MKKVTFNKLLILIILAAGFLSGCQTIPEPRADEPILIASTLTILDNLEAQKEIMLAFAKAYPTKVSNVEFIDDDWTMLVNGRRFYFANGRFLPGELRDQWENYYPWDFYAYPWVGTPSERLAAFNNPVRSVGSPYLFDTLWSAPNQDASWDMQVMYSFLGVKMIVHSYVAPILDRIQARIRRDALTDPYINEWIAELRTSPPSFGWNWRNIAGTNRRSNHSYGTAIDLLPRDLRGRHTYWQWTRARGMAKYTVSRETHYMPPESVVAAFENYGFLWGGNWNLIDTMHFEYRPEILILNNFQIERVSRD
ncbi:MAG: M15 family metallopeptidase [Spirochaetes bacterium]|nr:M15 family metallopeptidase [Spirochaetota bacterium]